MSTGEIEIKHPPVVQRTVRQPADRQKKASASLHFLLSPLWLCLLVALLVRLWLVLHTQGFIDGDEAMVGIQAQHILNGERPIYYFGQPYMGSLEAYFIAGLFALFGTSTTMMRVSPLLLSLVVVGLTWKIAGALAQLAGLSPTLRRWFMTLTALFAAFPPLYDSVIEMRTWGGHIETYIVTLWLLYSALRLTQRWREGSSLKEQIARWLGIGFLVGLGFWIYPLIIMAVAAATLWIGGNWLFSLIDDYKKNSHLSLWNPLKKLLLALVALPGMVIGFAPGIYWGATHKWANVLYILSPNNGSSSSTKLQAVYPNAGSLFLGKVKLLSACISPRIVSGYLPSEKITNSAQNVFYLLIGVGFIVIVAVVLLTAASLYLKTPILLQIQKLIGLPFLFMICVAAVFCFSNIAAAGLLLPCTRDEVGRYAAPMLLSLPFYFSTLLLAPLLYFQPQNKQTELEEEQAEPVEPIKMPEESPVLSSTPVSAILQKRTPLWLKVVLAVLLIGYLSAQTFIYAKTPARYTFQSFACVIEPYPNEPLIAYLQQQHIKYAWASMWIGNSILFKTHEQIKILDPRVVTNKTDTTNHLPAITDAVSNAKKASVLVFVQHNGPYPDILKALDEAHVHYKTASFPTGEPELGMDVMVITPLNKTLVPYMANGLGAWNYGC